MARTIQSPGVEINEIDLSLRPNLPIGTNILIPGFASQGPLDEVLQVASLSEFEQIYGLPTNAQERYFYHTVKGAFQSQGNINVSRLPYGAGSGDNVASEYSALVYPVTAKVGDAASPSTSASTIITINDSITRTVTDLLGATPAGETLTLTDANNNTSTFTATSGSNNDSTGHFNATSTVSVTVVGLASVINASSSLLITAVADLTTNKITLTQDTPGAAGNTAITSFLDGTGPQGIAHDQQFSGGHDEIAASAETNFSDDNIKRYVIGAPEHVTLSKSNFNKIKNGDISWSINSDSLATATGVEKIQHGGIVVLNNKSLTINEKFEGYYAGLIDTSSIEPGENYDSIKSIKTINKNSSSGPMTLSIPGQRLSFDLHSTGEKTADESNPYKEGTISEVVENLPGHDMSTSEYKDALILGIFKLRKSTIDPDTEKLDYILSEYHIGSLNKYREQHDPNGGSAVSFHLGDVSSKSPNFSLLINSHIEDSGDWVDRESEEEVPSITRSVEIETGTAPANALFPHGVYKAATDISRVVGAIPAKLDRIFEITDNHELFPLDLTLEAGLGTIFVATNGGVQTDSYNDEKFFDLDPNSEGLFSTGGQKNFGTDSARNRYLAVANVFETFASKKRKDHMCILDPIRHIFVQGPGNKTLDDKTKNFSQHIYAPLKHLYQNVNSSYAATYGNWMLVYDGQLNRNIWVPPSGYIGAMYANTDSNFQPWFAPAGFTRGVLSGVNDLAVYPKQKHRDQLYKININPIAMFPNDGLVVFGQKTLQSKPSAFDRVNVRRLFLYLEKATRSTVKYFVFEPNTLFTRSQVSNVLAPIFDIAKNTQGLYDYLLICDERNNTPDVIDQNELVIDIYIKPVRAAEFILVNFYATRTGQDFSELVS